MLELNPTGDTYSPNCTMNGMTYRKSRYFTLSAVIHAPPPRLAMNAMPANTGNSKICQPGMNWYQTINPTRIAKLMRKSTKATITAAIGTINRGKYTLLMRLAFAMTLFEAS